MPKQLDLFGTPVNDGKFRARAYQMDAHRKTWKEYERGSRGFICRQATGTGKTVTASLLIQQWLERDRNNRAMVIADQNELVWQFAQEIEDVTGERPRIEMAERRVFSAEDPYITVASRQSLQERSVGGETLSRVFAFDNTKNWLIIPDECHRWSPRLKSVRHLLDYFKRNPNSAFFGLTATPYRTDGVSLETMFPSIVLDYPLISFDNKRCAVADGWAVKYEQHFVRLKNVVFTELDTVRGDWDAAQMEAAILQEEQMATYGRPILDKVGNRRTLVFCPGVEMARLFSSWINAQYGQQVARFLDGSFDPEVRRDVYKQHKTGGFQFLVVCGLCREGYNDPGIQAVAVLRQTKSQALAEQMKGRGCRPIERLDHLQTVHERIAAIAASAKPNCMIIDLVGVSGMPDGPSTADIYAQSFGDDAQEIAKRAARLANDGVVDVAAAVQAAAEELQSDRAAEAAEEQRKAEEQARKAKQRDEELRERIRREQEEFERSRQLGVQVEYTSRIVESGGGGAVVRNGRMIVLATPRQMAALKYAGVPFDPLCVSKKVASRVLGQLRAGMTVQEVLRKNRLGRPKDSGPARATSNKAIEDVNRELLTPRSQVVDLSQVGGDHG